MIQEKAEEDGYVYNFKTELISYCMNDVGVLSQSINAFQKKFYQTARLDPFKSALTIPSACMQVLGKKLFRG